MIINIDYSKFSLWNVVASAFSPHSQSEVYKTVVNYFLENDPQAIGEMMNSRSGEYDLESLRLKESCFTRQYLQEIHEAILLNSTSFLPTDEITNELKENIKRLHCMALFYSISSRKNRENEGVNNSSNRLNLDVESLTYRKTSLYIENFLKYKDLFEEQAQIRIIIYFYNIIKDNRYSDYRYCDLMVAYKLVKVMIVLNEGSIYADKIISLFDKFIVSTNNSRLNVNYAINILYNIENNNHVAGNAEGQSSLYHTLSEKTITAITAAKSIINYSEMLDLEVPLVKFILTLINNPAHFDTVLFIFLQNEVLKAPALVKLIQTCSPEQFSKCDFEKFAQIFIKLQNIIGLEQLLTGCKEKLEQVEYYSEVIKMIYKLHLTKASFGGPSLQKTIDFYDKHNLRTTMPQEDFILDMDAAIISYNLFDAKNKPDFVAGILTMHIRFWDTRSIEDLPLKRPEELIFWLNYINALQDKQAFMINHNKLFVQLIYLTRKGKDSIFFINDEIKRISEQLYETYLSIPIVHNISTKFQDLTHEDSKDYLMFLNNKEAIVIKNTSLDTFYRPSLAQMVTPSLYYCRLNTNIYQPDNGNVPGFSSDYKLNELLPIFGIFHDSYNLSKVAPYLLRCFNIFRMGEYSIHFEAVLSRTCYTEAERLFIVPKLQPTLSNTLSNIYSIAFEENQYGSMLGTPSRDFKISKNYLAQLTTIFKNMLEENNLVVDNAALAAAFFCLATVYIKSSSEGFLGTEAAYPLFFLRFAKVLFQSARNLNPALLDNTIIKYPSLDIERPLLFFSLRTGKYSVSRLPGDMMAICLNSYPEIARLIIPRAWYTSELYFLRGGQM